MKRCSKSGLCNRKVAFGFGPFVLCRKHTDVMQANRKADLAVRGISPYTAYTEDDLYRWIHGLEGGYVNGGVA